MRVKYKIISKFYDLLDIFYFRGTDDNNPRIGMLEFIPYTSLKVLDICAGTCTNSIWVSKYRKKSEIVSIDICKEMLQIGQEKIKNRDVKNIKTKIMDATNLKFSEKSFDIIIISLVLHEVDEETRYKILRESKKVLKNNGRIRHMKRNNKSKIKAYLSRY